MKTNVTRENVLARIIKGGFNVNDANVMISRYFELAERRGCETVKDFAEEIIGFWA